MSTLGVVVAEFYPELADEMLALARDRAAERDATVAMVCRVPGVLDATLPADRLARRGDVDAVAVLGSVVAGGTRRSHSASLGPT